MINESHLLALTYITAQANADTFVMKAIKEDVDEETLIYQLAEIAYILAGTAGLVGVGIEGEKNAQTPEVVIETIRKIAATRK